ncbi:acyl-CoA-binding domain-containing protein 6-like [Glandiceps talaboti]
MMDGDDEHDEGHELEDRFEHAAAHVRSIVGKLKNDKLLYFYARFKQAKTGPCNTSRPGFFDFEGKQKWDAWKNLGDMDKEQAMMEYVSELLRVDPSWQPDFSDEGRRKMREGGMRGMGVAVSTMHREEEEDISDDQKTIFDWVKEGNVSRVKSIVRNGDNNIATQRDEEGLSLLHWACDRGHDDVVKLLLSYKVDINAKDNDGQTPLHYAVTCEFLSIINVLLDNGADPKLTDNDGCLPSENTYKKDIISLLQR